MYRLVDDVALDVRERQLELADAGLAVRAGNRDLDGDKVWIGSRIHSGQQTQRRLRHGDVSVGGGAQGEAAAVDCRSTAGAEQAAEGR